jgi:1-acyl-sn-glycerol-3-phosphate acyltransferase
MMRLLPSIAFNMVMFSAAAILSLAALALKPFAPGSVIVIGRFWSRLTLFALRWLCGVRLEITGDIPAGGGVIIAAQHQSAMDILVLLVLLKNPAFVLKQELLKLPLFGALLKPAGMIAVDRAGGAATLRKMVQDGAAQLAAGRPIVIFPEGTRVPPGARGTLHPGIVALAKALDVPVIPVTTDSGRRWGRKAFFKTPGPVHLRFCPALPIGLHRAAMIAALERCFYEGGDA